ncbi:28S ribosomal protein S18b, mitochondrial isoform X1 [Xenopus laevis]|uniref:Small ribosomal subunit protein mS40 n=2 Tax=Xenopus laevis TaxID=8355 RepID=A0A1L8F8M5_XENLA|nr:28S ribosomal protein S18b, mitochondrial isoform X1 [Xenopus laevis]OCT67934.1 hypothetical protein XELAEV_18039232mg [Xenopus laevis]
MATWLGGLCLSSIKRALKVPVPNLPLCSRQLASLAEAFDANSRYRDQPWEYMNSEEYLQRYDRKSIWADYRRNHKGPIPPQKTRKTCIRGGKICGNPCPICRDQKLGLHYRNVKLLQQFICPHTGIVYDPTTTGVCMKQQKALIKAITEATDHGFLPAHVSYIVLPHEDYLNSHSAVSDTPSPKAGPWYPWYEWQEPNPKEVARLRKLYKPYLKEMMGNK